MIVDIKLYRYRIALNRPLRISSDILTSRTGLILTLTDNHNHAGLGEIAPLPGLHQESIDDCIAQVRCVNRAGVLHAFYENDAITVWSEQLARLNLLPSVRFGLQSALLQLMACSLDKSVRSMLTNDPVDKVKVNALITDEQDSRIRNRSGFETFKIKTGRRPPEQEIDWIKKIYHSLPPGSRLRLDANCSWHLNEAITICRGLKGLPVEYLEEPLDDYRELPLLAEKVNIPIALDENLPKFIDRPIPAWIAALVVKPAIFPEITELMQLKNTGKAIVLSDTFQSGVGILMLGELAAALSQGGLAMGFDTLNWLSEDILINRPVIDKGSISLSDRTIRFEDLDPRQLTEIGL